MCPQQLVGKMGKDKGKGPPKPTLLDNLVGTYGPWEKGVCSHQRLYSEDSGCNLVSLTSKDDSHTHGGESGDSSTFVQRGSCRIPATVLATPPNEIHGLWGRGGGETRNF